MQLQTSGFYSDQLTLSIRDIWDLLRGVELQVGGLRIRLAGKHQTLSFTDGRWAPATRSKVFTYGGDLRGKD